MSDINVEELSTYSEYKSLEDFTQYMQDDEKKEFTHKDLTSLNFTLRKPIAEIRKQLESKGFKLQTRALNKSKKL